MLASNYTMQVLMFQAMHCMALFPENDSKISQLETSFWLTGFWIKGAILYNFSEQILGLRKTNLL